MPAKSAKQYRFMQAIAHGAKPYKGAGPSEKVAREFIEKTSKKKRSEFSKKNG
jgi:hypothetical protein